MRKRKTHRIGENICLQCDGQSVNIRNTEKGSYSSVSKENRQKKKKEKWPEYLNRHFFKDTQVANKHMKRCYTLGENVNWWDHYSKQYGSPSKH